MALSIRYSYEHLLARRGRSAATAAIIAMVVLATALFSGLVSSIRRTLISTGSERNLIVLRKGASNDGSSLVTLEDYRRLRLLPEIARNAAGEPLVSPELVVEPSFARPDGLRENVLVRGVEPIALEVHDEVDITAGRMLRASAGEAIVGRRILERYGVAGIGSTLHFGRSAWQVVGVFESGGSAFEGEVWVDVRQLADDAHRPQPYSGLRIRMAPGTDGAALARRIGDDQQASLKAEPEIDYYADQAKTADALSVIVIGLALLAGTAATFGAANTLYASVQSRRREIGTLRALGFPAAAILRSVLLESLLLSLAGFLLGCGSAWCASVLLDRSLSGVGVGSVLSASTQTVALRVGLSDLGLALGLVLAIALAGGFFPALRAARLEPAEALRR
jgi:putative ABC transport system permease protein